MKKSIDLKYKYICNILKRDIGINIKERIINIIKQLNTVDKISYQVIGMVSYSYRSHEVVIMVKCFDYEIRKKATGYFSIEYLYLPNTNEYVTASSHSRSMSITVKTILEILYGGWCLDEKQKEIKINFEKKIVIDRFENEYILLNNFYLKHFFFMNVYQKRQVFLFA